jgi:transitional endoplasmic reticulum ATPase
VHTKKKPISKDINLKELAKQTEGFSGAEIEAVCKRAAMLAIRGFDNEDVTSFKIRGGHFKRAVEETKE